MICRYFKADDSLNKYLGGWKDTLATRVPPVDNDLSLRKISGSEGGDYKDHNLMVRDAE
jgi:hypothetical protein